jgi:hypothetical protein
MAPVVRTSSGIFEFQQYQIRTFIRDGKASARAYFHGKDTTIVASAKTEPDAVLNVQQRLIARDTERQAKRRNGIPCADEYADAFAVLGIARQQREMLQAHLHAPDATMTAGEIAKVAGYTSYWTANSRYGDVGHKIGDLLNFKPPPLADDKTYWTSVLAEPGDNAGLPEESWTWKMRIEVMEGLVRSGRVAPAPA